MPTLYVPGVPQELHARLKDRAAARRGSLSREVIELLEWAVGEADRYTEATRLLEAIRRHRSFEPAKVAAPHSTSLLREDRGC